MRPSVVGSSGSLFAGPLMLSSAALRQARGPKEPVDPWRPVAVCDEEEVAAPGRGIVCRVVFLAGAECSLTCAMCDLWRQTISGPTPAGALPLQVESALAIPPAPGLGVPQWIKLYNASNFSDPRAVPTADLPRIATLVHGFERVIVETHPRLVNDSLALFAGAIGGRLEVGLGLETVDARFLPWLNKQMTPDDFAAACDRLRAIGVDARAFVLLGLPGICAEESVELAVDAARFAAQAGCRQVSLIPTRGGNGHVDSLAATGRFTPVSAAAAEAALAGAMGSVVARCLVTLDPWGWDQMSGQCDDCRAPRRARIERMNRAQQWLPPCPLQCGCRHGV